MVTLFTLGVAAVVFIVLLALIDVVYSYKNADPTRHYRKPNPIETRFFSSNSYSESTRIRMSISRQRRLGIR